MYKPGLGIPSPMHPCRLVVPDPSLFGRLPNNNKQANTRICQLNMCECHSSHRELNRRIESHDQNPDLGDWVRSTFPSLFKKRRHRKLHSRKIMAIRTGGFHCIDKAIPTESQMNMTLMSCKEKSHGEIYPSELVALQICRPTWEKPRSRPSMNRLSMSRRFLDRNEETERGDPRLYVENNASPQSDPILTKTCLC